MGSISLVLPLPRTSYFIVPSSRFSFDLDTLRLVDKEVGE